MSYFLFSVASVAIFSRIRRTSFSHGQNHRIVTAVAVLQYCGSPRQVPSLCGFAGSRISAFGSRASLFREFRRRRFRCTNKRRWWQLSSRKSITTRGWQWRHPCLARSPSSLPQPPVCVRRIPPGGDFYAPLLSTISSLRQLSPAFTTSLNAYGITPVPPSRPCHCMLDIQRVGQSRQPDEPSTRTASSFRHRASYYRRCRS